MQENKKTLKRSSLARILALIAALAVIIGSIAALRRLKRKRQGFWAFPTLRRTAGKR